MSTKVSKKETTVGSGESLNMFRVMMEQNQFGDDVLLIQTTKSYIFFLNPIFCPQQSCVKLFVLPDTTIGGPQHGCVKLFVLPLIRRCAWRWFGFIRPINITTLYLVVVQIYLDVISPPLNCVQTQHYSTGCFYSVAKNLSIISLIPSCCG